MSTSGQYLHNVGSVIGPRSSMLIAFFAGNSMREDCPSIGVGLCIAV